MISTVARRYNIHPQTLRLYEREGLLKPSRTDGNTRLYAQEDLERLETILTLTRDLGVNLAGVEIILNMRQKMDRMQHEVNEFMAYVKRELGARAGRLGAAAGHGAGQVAALDARPRRSRRHGRAAARRRSGDPLRARPGGRPGVRTVARRGLPVDAARGPVCR